MKLSDKIEDLKGQMLDDLKQLLSIKSVVGAPEGEAPFGIGVDNAFKFMLKLAEREGFDYFNADNYGGHIDFGRKHVSTVDSQYDSNNYIDDEVFGILCHLDVVPEGSNWDHDPYGGEIKDGKIYGRGAIDDKGPSIAAFYAMKAIKDTGFIPSKKVRLILGLDEETEWIGIEYYKGLVKMPDFAIVPDASFPVINGEKGIIVCDLVKKIGKSENRKGISLRRLNGGNAPNMVADKASAVVRNDVGYREIKEKIDKYNLRTGYEVKSKGRGRSLEIYCEGISAHGATPEKGINAISILMDMLKEIQFNCEEVNEFIDFYNNHIGFELDGESLGCKFSDEPSGDLILNTGMLEGDEEAVKLVINIRYPVTLKQEDVYEAMSEALKESKMGVIKKTHKNPIYKSPEDEFIKTLMEVYKEHTCDDTVKPVVTGGGTYARAMSNAVAFGPLFPGQAEVEHQRNEYADIDSLVLATKIYADTIVKLTGAVQQGLEVPEDVKTSQ